MFKTYDDCRDIAIRITDKLIEEGLVKDCIDTDDLDEFTVQDIALEIIAEALEVKDIDYTEYDKYVLDNKGFEDTIMGYDQWSEGDF